MLKKPVFLFPVLDLTMRDTESVMVEAITMPICVLIPSVVE